jgi:hypothetical protein
MKKILSLIIGFLIFASCSSSDFTADSSGVITGKVFRVGNEPFTKLGLQVENAKMYILSCDKETESLLTKNQGQDFSITFKGTEKSIEGITLKVTKAEKSQR